MKVLSSSSEVARTFDRSKEQQVVMSNMASRAHVRTELATHEREKHDVSVVSNAAQDVQKVGSTLDVKA